MYRDAVDGPVTEADWERRVADAWASLDGRSESEFAEFLALIENLTAELPPDSAVGSFERAAAFDSLRNLGRPEESVALLTTELDAGSDHLDDAVRAFLALALTDVGREWEAVSLALAALSPHLPRCQCSLANYARLLAHAGPEAS